MGALGFKLPEEQIIVPFSGPREQVHPPRSIRSTLLASSLRALHQRGRFDDYVRHLDAPWRDLPDRAIAGVWLPFAAGLAHYMACDALGFSAAEQHEIGRDVGDRIHGTFLGAMIRAARNVGVTPWLALGQTRKLYDRLFDGGDVCVVQVGPKDARMDLVSNPLAGVAYFRNAMRGLWQVGLEHFCSKAYVTEIGRSPSAYRVRIAWA